MARTSSHSSVNPGRAKEYPYDANGFELVANQSAKRKQETVTWGFSDGAFEAFGSSDGAHTTASGPHWPHS
jgi:hypothetical protein